MAQEERRSKRVDVSGVRIPGTTLEGARAIAVIAIAIYVLLFVVLNNDRVTINFVLFRFRTNELLGYLLILALGFAVGYIVRGRRLGPPRRDSVVEHPAIEAPSRRALPGGAGVEEDAEA